MNGVNNDESGQGTREGALEGQGEEDQAGGEGAALAEGRRVGPDGVADAALMVADLLGQMAGAKIRAKGADGAKLPN